MPEFSLTASTPRIVQCTSIRAVASTVRAHPIGDVSTVSSTDIGIDAPRAWWPLLDQCCDRRVADVVADHLTRDLPPSLVHVIPEAATLLAGALHAASLVGWPTITLTHILDSGAVATVTELLTGQDESFALDVAAAAGPSAAENGRVIAAAAIAAQQLHHGEGLITGPGALAAGAVLGGAQTPVVAVHDDGSAVANLVISRLRFLGSRIVDETEAA